MNLNQPDSFINLYKTKNFKHPKPDPSPLGLPEDVREVLERLLVAVAGRREAGQRGVVGLEPQPLVLHQALLPLLRFRELGGDDHQAQVDHEERTDLKVEV